MIVVLEPLFNTPTPLPPGNALAASRYRYYYGYYYGGRDDDTVVVEVFVIVSGQRRAMGVALIFWLCAGGKEATPSLYVLTYRQNSFVV